MPPDYRGYFEKSITTASPPDAWKEVFRHVLFYKGGLPYCIDSTGSYGTRIKNRYHGFLAANFSSSPEQDCGRFYAHTQKKSVQATGRAFEMAIERILTLTLIGRTCSSGSKLVQFPEFQHLSEFKQPNIPFKLRLIYSEVQPDMLVEARGSLQAVVSTKWTLRNDRAENARTEAQNLKQLCNGRVPYIALVTNENSPQRLLSVARGYDLGRVYHCNLDLLRSIYSPSPSGPSRSGKAHDKQDMERSTLISELVQAGRLRDLKELFADLNAV